MGRHRHRCRNHVGPAADGFRARHRRGHAEPRSRRLTDVAADTEHVRLQACSLPPPSYRFAENPLLIIASDKRVRSHGLRANNPSVRTGWSIAKTVHTARRAKLLMEWLLGLDSNPPPPRLRRAKPATLRLTVAALRSGKVSYQMTLPNIHGLALRIRRPRLFVRNHMDFQREGVQF